MKKELGKWLMDIAKYMATVLLLSTVFADMANPIIFSVVISLSLVLLLSGLAVIHDGEKSNNNNKVRKKWKK